MKKRIFIDMDDVLCEYSKTYAEHLLSQPGIIYPQSQLGFFWGLPPIENAIDSVKNLIDHTDYDPYILTAPSTKNPASYTEKRLWIEKYFGYEFTNKLIISPDKGIFKGDLLVDDNLSGQGQENFDGELIHFGSETFPNWNEVMKYLINT